VEDGEIEDAKLSDSAARGAGPTPIEQPDARAETNVRGSPALATSTKPVEESTATRVQQDSGPPPSQLPPKPEIPSSRHPIKATLPNSDTRPTSAPSPNDVLTSNHPTIPARPEPGIKTSISTVNDRIPYNLPNRPEPPSSKSEDQRIIERLGARDHGRDSRFIERGRADRPGDALRDRVQEHSISGPYNRGYDQNPERPYMQDRNRLEPGWGEEKSSTNRPNSDDRHNGPRRDSRPPSRDGRAERSQRDRSFPEVSHLLPRSEFQGQPLREPTMAPPRSNILQHSNPPLGAHHSDRRSDSNRYESFSTSERSSRVGSPSRNEDRRSLRHEGRHDDRLITDSRYPSDASSHSQPSRYENSHLPTGPRTDRATAGGPPSSSDKFRDSMNLTSTAMPAPNPNLGRLNQDLSHHLRQEESQYGRLNPGPEIPSGPRLSNGSNLPPPPRGGSTVTPTLPRTNHQQSPHTTQTLPPPLQIPDKQAPTGPSPRGIPRAVSAFSRPEPTFSAPPTPVSESPDTASVHPDRLKAIQGLESASLVDESETQSSTRQLPPSSLPPSGARGLAPSPVGPSPNARGPPTGPSFAIDRNRGDKRFAGLQHVLQQANIPNGVERSGQGASIRGRGGRANSVHVPSPLTTGPPLPSVARPEAYSSRGDLFAGRTSGPSTPPTGDDGGYGRIARRGGISEMAREGERRSERHRNNRTPSRERVPRPTSLRENEVAMRREDPRERMVGRLPMEREMRRPGREDINRDRRGEFEHSEMGEWARDERGPSRDERERRDGGGSGRKRGRGGEEGPGERNYTDTKRPRRAH
jgi:THO complex subunit 2